MTVTGGAKITKHRCSTGSKLFDLEEPIVIAKSLLALVFRLSAQILIFAA